MEAALATATRQIALALDAMALAIVAFGSVEAFIAAARALFKAESLTGHERRAVWMRYARWLVAALTFQLAADIVTTAITPSWDEIGRLGAIAAIRTFLNFFLERDIGEVQELQRARREPSPPAEPMSRLIR